MVNSFDIETFGRDPVVPYCICLIYNNNKFAFYGLECVADFLKFIFDLNDDDITIFAHNLTFDGGIIINYMDSSINIENIGTYIVKCDIYSLVLSKGYKKIKLRCSAKLLPMRLSDIAVIFNLPKKKEMNHSAISSSNYNNLNIRTSVVSYCMRDAEIVKNFIKTLDILLSPELPDWRYYSYSISGIALRLFKKKYNTNSINLKLNNSIDSLVRRAYYGGRCEVFGNKTDLESVFHYDFTGMYTERLTEDYPIDDPTYEENINSIDKPGFYCVSVHSKDLHIPILPYRSPVDGKLLFPNGKFIGVYWYEELKLFTKNGGLVVKIHWALTFNNIEKPFKSFSEKCIELRKKDKISKIIWKIIPNSFIGRLGLKRDYEKTIIIHKDNYNACDYRIVKDKKINNFFVVTIKTLDNTKIDHSNVCYAAITTSKARILWWESANFVQNNGGRLLYCDTDSLFVAYTDNIIGQQHGNIYWDPLNAKTIVLDSIFITNKVYAVRYANYWDVKIKGVPSGSVSIDELLRIKDAGSDLKVKYDYFEKKNIITYIKEVNKIIYLSKYNKRTLDESKTRTNPLYIEDTLDNEILQP